MASRYSEIVVEGGPAGFTQGFIVGFARGRGEEGPIFNAEAEGFDCSTLRERLRDLVRPQAQTLHVVVPAALVATVREAVATARADGHEAEIVRESPVRGARFVFRFSIYSREEGSRLQALLSSLPDGLRLAEGTKIEEKLNPEATGVEMYSPVHEYELSGSGGVEGDVAATVELYRELREEPLVETLKLELVEGKG